MTTYAWITDPHFDFITIAEVGHFGERVADEFPDAPAAIITGDIANFRTLRKCLLRFQSGFGKPVYIVLGNHDAYGGAVEALPDLVANACAGTHITYLPSAEPIMDANGMAILGVNGWYDARAGNPEISPVHLSDFHMIREFRGKDRAEIITQARLLADFSAQAAREKLAGAYALGAKAFLFATHVPPWVGATWHEGEISNSDFTPWFTNTALGRTIDEFADEHPELPITVICGHTHSSGRHRPRQNVVCLTGRSKYGTPSVERFVTVVEEQK